MKAELIDHMGDDLRVVNAARVSFDKESEMEMVQEGLMLKEVLSLPDQKLLSYLAKHNHWTPFSHPQITMRETVPIFVARQRFKHMVGFTYNEVSRRYVDDEPEFYVPDVWRSRPEGSVKQGSGTEKLETPDFKEGYVPNYEHSYEGVISKAKELYTDMLNAGYSPEQARMVLPQSMYTSYYVTGSLAAWARAYTQRTHSTAQQEIQDLAKQWGEAIQPLFPQSWEALTNEH